jgi:hypothetical protein
MSNLLRELIDDCGQVEEAVGAFLRGEPLRLTPKQCLGYVLVFIPTFALLFCLLTRLHSGA